MSLNRVEIEMVTKELSSILPAICQKIYNFSKTGFLIELYGRGAALKLLIELKQPVARLHQVTQKYSNNQSPTPFCLILRKYLTSSRLVDCKQINNDRIIELEFNAQEATFFLIYEPFNHSLFLTDSSYKIISDYKNPLNQGKRYSPPNAPPC